MGARYPYYLLADSRTGQLKEAEIERKAPSRIPPLRRHPPGLRLWARAPHHPARHRQQRRDRRHLGRFPATVGAVARRAERRARHGLGGVGDPPRGRRGLAARREKTARKLVAAAHRPPAGDRRLHRRQGRLRIPLRQALRGPQQSARRRPLHRREHLPPPRPRRRRERRVHRHIRRRAGRLRQRL